MINRDKIICLYMVVLALIVSPQTILSDDTGMLKARLFEEPAGEYVLEVDIDTRLLGFISFPVLPERFRGSERTAYKGEGSLLTVEYFFGNPGNPLTSDEVIILNWNRTGVSFTAQWADGFYARSFFTRGPEGFIIPVKKLMNQVKPFSTIAAGHLLSGFVYPFKSLSFILLMAFSVLFFSRINIFGILAGLAAGFVSSMVLAEAGLSGIPIGFSELMLPVAVIITLLSMGSNAYLKNIYHMYFAAGLLYGLGYCYAQQVSGMQMEGILTGSFFFHFGLSLSLLVVFGLANVLDKAGVTGRMMHSAEKYLFYGTGSAAVLFLLLTFSSIDGRGIYYGLQTPEKEGRDIITLPEGLVKAAASTARPVPSSSLELPVELFLTIEPYEVRLEALVNAAEINSLFDNIQIPGSVIEIEKQNALIETLLKPLNEAAQLRLNGNEVSPVSTRGDFVTVTSKGIFTRSEPVPEITDEAVIGLVYIYEFDGLPDSAGLTWKSFTSEFTEIPLTSTGPFGGEKVILSESSSLYEWKNKLKGYRIPEVTPVQVEARPVPVVSVLIFLLTAGWFIVYKIKGKALAGAGKNVMAGLLLFAFLAYPFLRVSADVPVINSGEPNLQEAKALAGALLTNIYRALDFRDEDAVYDRLALTVHGNQLTEIYLQSRRSMELENRGGARGKVNEVEVLEIKSVERKENGSTNLELVWKVGGSVNHFGHTHYRQNKNHAILTILRVGNTWKVESIDIIDETRLL